MNFEKKYLKYKNKYLSLKKYILTSSFSQFGGDIEGIERIDMDFRGMGDDVVVLLNKNTTPHTLYVNTHLKDYSNKNRIFIDQFKEIIKFISTHKEKKCILMMDANSQFRIEGSTLHVFSKDDPAIGEVIDLEDNIFKGIISPFPTSNKMRGIHTAQLNKYLVPVNATIDHIFMFNGNNDNFINTLPYIISNERELLEIRDNNTLTISPISIPDHAFVISTDSNGISYGTLNIKGGNVDDKAWAEFIPAEFYNYFMRNKSYIDSIITDTFSNIETDLKKITAKNYLSNPRFKLFDVNLSNEDVPDIYINSQTNSIKIIFGSTIINIVKNCESNIYFSIDDTSKLKNIQVYFIRLLLDELNDETENYNKRNFFISKGFLLLKLWYNIQKDTNIINGGSLSDIFNQWYEKTKNKIPIHVMIQLAKNLYPNLKVIGIQEMPKEGEQLKKEIEDNVSPKCFVYLSYLPSKNTQGAIVVFDN
jgi:hypothetical protein